MTPSKFIYAIVSPNFSSKLFFVKEKFDQKKHYGSLIKRNTKEIFYFIVLFACIFSTSNALSQSNSATHLGIMPTAETLGKGGYSTSIAMFKYKADVPGSQSAAIVQNVVIGNFFLEKHEVEYHANAELLPIILEFGVSEYVDFYLGGTYSIGDSYKTIADYYETGSENKREYSQFLFDGIVGLKYNLKPDVGDGLPAFSIGGEIQTGYTSDDKETSDGTLVDDTPANSFPFVSIGTYFVASQNLQMAKLHGAVGMFLSSKSPRITDSFKPSIQVGGELMLAENLALIGDFTTAWIYSGVDFKNLLSVGFRYDISDRAAFSVSFASASSNPGFQFNLFVSGEKARPLAPEKPKTGGEELLF